MKKEVKIEDSPFYIEYSQNKDRRENLSTKLEPDKLKTFKRHLKGKHNGDEELKDTEFSFSYSTNLFITKYLQEQCLQMKTFNKSIFAIFNMDKLKKDEDSITPLFVTDNNNAINGMISSIAPVVIKSKKHQQKHDYMDEEATYKAHAVSIDDFKNNMLQELDEHLQHIFASELKQYRELSDGINVLEIALNNYLDVPHDGIFSNVSDSNIHDGVNFIETNIGFYGVIYQWRVKEDYSIEIIAIQVCEQQEILDLLLEHNNSQLYKWYGHFFMSHDNYSQANELEVMQKEMHDLNKKINHEKNKVKEANKNIERWEKEFEAKQNEFNHFKASGIH